MNEVDKWLSRKDRSFKDGLALLKPLIKNKFLLRSLSLKQNNYTWAKLNLELEKFATVRGLPLPALPVLPVTLRRQQPGIILPVPGQYKKIAEESGLNAMTEEQTRKAVEKLEVGLSKMYNKKGILSNSLRSFDPKDNEGRKKVLERISSLTDDMEQVRKKLAHYQKTGKLPPLPVKQQAPDIFQAIPRDPIAMKSMLLNERSNISKYKRKLKSDISAALKERNKKRLDDAVKVVAEIERRLNGK